MIQVISICIYDISHELYIKEPTLIVINKINKLQIRISIPNMI